MTVVESRRADSLHTQIEIDFQLISPSRSLGMLISFY